MPENPTTLSPHSIISALIGVLFVVVLQAFAAPVPVFRFLLPAFIIYLGAVTAYNHWFLREGTAYNIWTLVRPGLFILGWFGLYFIIPNTGWRGVFLLLAAAVIYFMERLLGNQGEQLVFNETLIISFAGFMTLTALSHYYLIPGTAYLAAVFVWTAAVARSSYELTPVSSRAKWINSICLAFVMAELFWACSFLPLHYSALGLLMFNTFYCAWTLCYHFLYNHLTAKKIQYHVVLSLLFTALILAVTPWRILQ